MIKTETLIVGQGISGTFLSWYLHKAGRSFVVIDNNERSASSRVAAGIINPVTGRRIVRTWMIETLMPFAVEAYEEMGRKFGVEAISEKQIIDFFPSVQMKLAFEERLAQGEEYLSLPHDENDYQAAFQYELGYGVINKSYIVNLKEVLAAFRNFLSESDVLIEENFDINLLDVGSNIQYKQITAEKIIFCDGIYSSTNKFFKNLPFALNKGEAVIVECDTISQNNIYKKGITLAPIGGNYFWAGSSHEWDFADNQPSQKFFHQTFSSLGRWLKHPFKVVDRLASIRPATVERRPFVGMHPAMPNVGILNGMGTKGCSLAPYFARQLADHVTKNTAILPGADVKRFSRILQSTT